MVVDVKDDTPAGLDSSVESDKADTLEEDGAWTDGG